ncbi:MAG: extracellular solute-binding protein [Minisyncoccia bacterium]|jgi:maltose-binding protein MalE
MKISLFQGILFGVFGVAALVGLFVFATHTNSNNSGKNAVGTVVIWGTLPKADMDTALTAIAKADTSLKDVSYVQKDPATLPNDLSAAIATGAAPNLVLASQEELLSLAKFITPIPSATLPASTFSSTFVGEGGLFAAANGYYGIPFLVDPLVLFSNRTILSSDGIAKPPATWEALAGLVPNVAILTSARQITRGLIAFGTYDNVHDARGILSALFIQTGVPISSYSSSTGLLSADLGENFSNGTSPGQEVIGFYTQFADPSKISYTWNALLPDSEQAFLAGDLALYLGYASEARYLATANPNLDFGVAPLPQPATATVKSTYGLVYALMIPVGAKNTAGAYQAAALLTNAAEQEAAVSATSLAPAVLNELATVPTDPTAAAAYAGALYAKGWLSPAPADTDSVFSGMIGNVISGRSTLETALVSAGQSLSALLQQ